MFREFILVYAKVAIAVMSVLFIFVKLLLIRLYGLRQQPGSLFMMSLRILGKPVIDNTYFDKLKKYFQVSNKVNLFFYGAVVLLFALYMLVKFYLP